MAEYPGRLPLFHIDLYRLADASDALAGGLIDDRQAAGLTLVEWPERLGPALPARRLDVVIDGSGDDPRSITLRAVGEGFRALPRGRLDERAGHPRHRQRHHARRGRPWRPGRHAHRAHSTGRPAIATARRSCPPSTTCSVRPGSTERSSAPSWSGPGRARSRACASASRRRRASPMAWAARSSASRPPRRCWPGPRRGPCSCCRPARPIACSCGMANRRGWSRPARSPRSRPARRSSRSICRARPGRGRGPRRDRARRAGGRARQDRRGTAAAGDVDDLARLVPEYVTLPRGVRSEGGEVAWSHDRP